MKKIMSMCIFGITLVLMIFNSSQGNAGIQSWAALPFHGAWTIIKLPYTQSVSTCKEFYQAYHALCKEKTFNWKKACLEASKHSGKALGHFAIALVVATAMVYGLDCAAQILIIHFGWDAIDALRYVGWLNQHIKVLFLSGFVWTKEQLVGSAKLLQCPKTPSCPPQTACPEQDTCPVQDTCPGPTACPPCPKQTECPQPASCPEPQTCQVPANFECTELIDGTYHCSKGVV